MSDVEVAKRALVVGLAVTGEAVARQLLARGVVVVVMDDNPDDATRRRADALGVDLIEKPDAGMLASLLDDVDLVLPSPGVPAGHGVFAGAAARGLRVWSEFELAARWSSVPLVAITGTNGKTTVTTLVTDMLAESGKRVTAAGNTEVPLVDVLDRGLDVVVVEASSFRLKFTETFRPTVAAWLNLAEDHLDWHPSLDDYARAKAQIWANQRPNDVAVVNADDTAVMQAARSAPGRVITFGLTAEAEYGWDRARGVLAGPDGTPIVAVSDVARRLPHDLANALAASAVALSAGATVECCRSVLMRFTGLPHRVALVRDIGGVRYYDDSKSTTPASVLAAVNGFDSVVLIAGGRNKSLDLSVLGRTVPPVKAVIALGEAAADVMAAFSGLVPVVRTTSMRDAVSAAAAAAIPGDVVLLSPGCASFDMYEGYRARGDAFVQEVEALAGRGANA